MRTALLAPGTNDPGRQLTAGAHETRDVNAEALQGMTIVRRFALADMYDRERVIGLVGRLGFRDGAEWMRANRHLYFVALHRLTG